MVETLVANLRTLFETLPDSRSGVIIQYAFDDIAMVRIPCDNAQTVIDRASCRDLLEQHNQGRDAVSIY